MVPSPSSDLLFLDLKGQQRGVEEWRHLLLRLPCAPDDWHGVSLTVNGMERPAQLRRFGQTNSVVCDWPPSAAGTYQITVTGMRQGTVTQRLFVPPAKLSTTQLSTLLTDLDQRLPHALVASLRQGGALAGLHGQQPPGPTGAGAELERLCAIVDGDRGLAALLRRIAHDPHRRLQEVLWDVPTARARRIGPRQLREALYRDRHVDDDGVPLRICDRRVEPTCDVPENRLLRHLHDMVRGRLARLALILRDDGNGRCAQVMARLKTARQTALFLDEVGALPHPPTQPSQVMIHRPDYARVLSLWRQLTEGLTVRLDDASITTGMDSVPALYELWGCLSVMAMVAGAAVEQGFQVIRQTLVMAVPGCLLVRLPPGGQCALELAHEDGRRMTGTPQRSFGPGGPLRSVSFPQRPDLVVELAAPGVPPRLLIFDPKYKLGDGPGTGPQKSDIDKMHAYRDAIIHADGRRAVRHAAILYPGPDRCFGAGVSAIGAVPGDDAPLTARVRQVLETHLFRDDPQPPS